MAQTKACSCEVLCPDCEVQPFSRNHYFTGKLLVERDFTDEQHYHMAKMRHHNQRLHGWGVVCGLAVKQHPNPACRDRLVIVEPGTAIDCCGREIVVTEPEHFDISQLPAIQELAEAVPPTPHRVQICIRYKECPTEEIPVLYDDCGCDDTQCAPNRILESFELDVLIDQPIEENAFKLPVPQWTNTITIAHAFRVAVHAPTQKAYIMAGVPATSVYRVNTINHAIEESIVLPAKGIDLAVSNDGSRVYIVTGPPPASVTNDRFLIVRDASDLAGAGLPEVDIPDSEGSDVALAVAPDPDNRLFALVTSQGHMLVWTADINDPGTPTDPASVVLASNLSGFAIGANHAYAGDPASHGFWSIDTTTLDANLSTPLSDDATPSALAVVPAAAGERLAVADQSHQRLSVIATNPQKTDMSIALPYSPIDIAVSASGHWIYALERNGTDSYVQVVSIGGETGEPIEVGPSATQVVAVPGGNIYVPNIGDEQEPSDGGVAILEVADVGCCEVLWDHLNGCPACDTANCVVLATIENYQPGFTLLDQTSPPADPVADIAAQIARINNRLGRRLLPSTQVLTEIVRCLCEGATSGQPGPPGEPGPAGPPGDPGPGLEANLTRITGISWRHNLGNNPFLVVTSAAGNNVGPAVVVAFDNEVQVGTVDPFHVFRVEVYQQLVVSGLLGRQIHAVTGRIVGVDPTINAQHRVTAAQEHPGPTAKGVAFVLDEKTAKAMEEFNEVGVRFQGDFVLDTTGRAIDAEFARAKLPSGDRPAGSAFGVQGGVFESWFFIKQ
jgi:DNA-binding beta-propeller fold protein YncE